MREEGGKGGADNQKTVKRGGPGQYTDNLQCSYTCCSNINIFHKQMFGKHMLHSEILAS